MNTNTEKVFNNFTKELENYTQTGEFPASAGWDFNYCLDLQRKRLEKKKLNMEYRISSRGHLTDPTDATKSWSDKRYISMMQMRSCEFTKVFTRDDKVLLNKRENSIIYEVVTDVLNEEMVEEDTYICPNCAAISKVADLRKGCPYCGTFFEMSDLYPKVTNYYLGGDVGGTIDEVVPQIMKFVIPPAAVVLIWYLVNVFIKGYGMGPTEVFTAVAVAFGGALLGYVAYVISLPVTAILKANKSLSGILEATGSAKKFTGWMQQYSPEFSYQYFSDKVITILKMLMFAESPEELPYYVGKPIGNIFTDIVETTYTGAVALKRVQTQGPYCYITVDVYMEDVYDDGNRLKTKKDVFQMVMCMNFQRPIDMSFSIKKIQCKGCGVSFDATKQKNCPSCGRRYEIGDDDWVVVAIEKK